MDFRGMPSHIFSFLKLTRFWNLAIIALAQFFTARFLVGGHVLYNHKFYLLSLSTVLIAAGGYIINDYYDVKIDYINKPDRVVVGKEITRRFAILYHVVLSGAGILVGLYLSHWIALVNIFSVFVLWLYSNNLKRLPFIGNLSIALLTGLSVGMINFFDAKVNDEIMAYAFFAFAMTLIREIIKDIEDVRGDDTFGCQTLPIVLGIRKTKQIVYLLTIAFSGTVLYLNARWTHLPLTPLCLVLFLPLAALLFMLFRADTQQEFARANQLCKIIMLLGIGSMMI